VTWRVESAGLQLLQFIGSKQIVILGVLANETGNVGTERDNPQTIGAGIFKRHSGELCRQALAFQPLRHFGVVKNNALRKSSIGQQRRKAINNQFEAFGLFVVDDC